MSIRLKQTDSGILPAGNPATASIARFAAEGRFAAMPAVVVAHAKNSFLDALGITLAGVVEPAGRIAVRHAMRAGGIGEASIFCSRVKVPAMVAARVNGTCAHAVGFSDFSVPALMHPSVAVLPAVWAIGESRRASGEDLLCAYAIGVEVSCKIARALTPDFTQRGFHPCAVVGTLGAAVAAGKLLGLDATKLACVLGIAGVRAAGIKVSLGSMAKAYAVGNAAEGGVAAAELAELGLTGPDDVLEGRDGFFATFGNGLDASAAAAGLGAPWEFESPGITIKPYPACTRSHPAIDAALEVYAQPGFDFADVESVQCDVTPEVLQVVRVSSPVNPMEAKFSLPFCMAAALTDGYVAMDSFTDEKLSAFPVRSLMQRVQPAAVDAMRSRGPFAAEVAVRLKSGRVYRGRCDFNLWDQPDHLAPAKREQLVRKFRQCAGRVLGNDGIAQIIEIIDRLEREPDLESLMGILRGAHAIQ
jgi:2-methylcitrate dehydratase PrpD